MGQRFDDEFCFYDFDNLLVEAERRYGKISPYYLRRCLDVTGVALNKFNRVFALRVDLHFSCDVVSGDSDSPTCFQYADTKVITRFMESLKSLLREEHKRKRRPNEPALFEYIWVREQKYSMYPHYHLMLFFNKDEYAFLGNYRELGANNMATRIQRAWCSALRLPHADYASLVHFPDNSQYRFDRNSERNESMYFYNFLLRLVYVAKVRTKNTGAGQRNFGCSQSRL